MPVALFGLNFPNPVGLAAGMDKGAAAVPAWKALGFGFCELGGVTWHAQEGNPQPRMFRAIPHEALINRMGFNNPGAEALARRLADWRARGRWPRHPVGINLGKSKITPLEKAPADYAQSFRLLKPHADFFVVNVSSPNTPGLRQLQDKTALDEILAGLQELNAGAPNASDVGAIEHGPSIGDSHTSSLQQLESHAQRPSVGGTSYASPQPENRAGTTPMRLPQASAKPILVKVAPDLEFSALDQILELVGPRQVAGLIATNTTITRPSTSVPELNTVYAEQGGLSGRPLAARSTEVIRHLYRQTRGGLPIIGVGGIFDADDAWQKITAGASLLQIYTGLVYRGPGIVRDIVNGLRARLAACGSRLADATGSANT